MLVTGNIDADLSATSNGGNAAAVVIGSDGDITVNGMIGGSMTAVSAENFAAGMYSGPGHDVPVGEPVGNITVGNDFQAVVSATAETDKALGIFAEAGNVTIGSFSGSIAASGDRAVGIQAGKRYDDMTPVEISKGTLSITNGFSGEIDVDADYSAIGLVATDGLSIGRIDEAARVNVASEQANAYGMVSLTGITVNGNAEGSLEVSGKTDAFGVIASAFDDESGPEPTVMTVTLPVNNILFDGDFGMTVDVSSDSLQAGGLVAEDDITITGSVFDSSLFTITGATEAHGMNAGGSVYIGGDMAGDMTVSSTGDFSDVSAVTADGVLTIDGGVSSTSEINVTGGAYADGLLGMQSIAITGDMGGTITASADGRDGDGSPERSVGIGSPGEVSIGSVSGTVDVTSDNGYVMGIGSGTSVAVNGDLGGSVAVSARYQAIAIGADGESVPADIDIAGDMGGALRAESVEGPAAGVYSTGSVFIAGDVIGTVTADSGNEADAIMAGGMVEVDGSITAASSMSVTSSGVYGNGILAGTGLAIAGDMGGSIDVDVAGSDAEIGTFSIGAGAYGPLALGGMSGTVSVTRTYGTSIGIGSTTGVHIEGDLDGFVTAEGSEAAVAVSAHPLDGIAPVPDPSLTVTGDVSGTLVARSGSREAVGMMADSIVLGGLSGTVEAYGGPMAAGLYAKDGAINGGDATTPLGISGSVTAEAAEGGLSAAIISSGPVNLDVTGELSGGESGYAFFSGQLDTNGVLLPSAVDDMIAIGDAGRITGKVDLGGGSDIMTVGGSAVLNGDVLFGAGDDRLTITGTADMTGVSLLDGGADTDTMTLDGWNGGFGEKVEGWEYISLVNGSSVHLGGQPGVGMTLDITELSIDETSTLFGYGFSPIAYTINGNVINNGTIDLQDPEDHERDAGDSFTITGSYTGSNGTIKVDIDSGSGEYDKLVIQGPANGSTSLVINELGDEPGLGDNGPQDIITYDENESSADPFAEGTYYVGVSQYDFTMTYAPEGDFVFSDLEIVGFRDEAALMQGVVPFVQKLGYASVHRFHERRSYVWSGEHDGNGSSIWTELYGSKYRLGHEGDAATKQHGYTAGTRIGYDLVSGRTENGRYHSGLYGSFGYASADVDGIDAAEAGALAQQSYSLGVYASYHAPEWFYIDAVVQAGWHDIQIGSPDEPAQLDTDTWGYIASLEAGIGIPASDTFRFEPRAQLIYQHTGEMILADTDMGHVTINERDGLEGRLGLTGIVDNGKGAVNPFVEVNLVKEFGENNTVSYVRNSETLSSEAESLFFGGAIGISREAASDGLDYFVRGDAMYGIDGLNSYEYRVMAGISKTF